MESYINKVYVINMDKDVERIKDFDIMMKEINCNYERFSAVNGKELGQYLEKKEQYIKSLTSPGEIGCMLSHILLWEKVLDNNYKRVIIFEDDARSYLSKDKLQEKLIKFYQHIESNNIEEPDLLYLGKCLDKTCYNYEQVIDNVYKNSIPLCTHAYIINSNGAKKLLSLDKFSNALDMMIIDNIDKGVLTTMTFHPSLFYQDVIGNKSNLREFSNALNNTQECKSVGVTVNDHFAYYIPLVVLVLSCIILFVLLIFQR